MTPHTNGPRTLSHLLAAWVDHMRTDQYSEATIRLRTETVRSFATHHQTWDGRLTEQHVRAYLNNRPMKPASVLTYLRCLTAFARWAGYPDPTLGIRRPAKPEFCPRPVSEPDLQLLLAHATGRMRTWTVLGAFTGLRAAEAAHLSVDHIVDLGDRRLLRFTGKGGRTAAVPLSPVVDHAVRTHLPADGRLWPRTGSKDLSRYFRAFARTVGVDATFHQLRHRYGTQVYRHTRDLVRTQKLMRHSSPKTTTAYIALDDAFGQAVDLLPGATPPDEEPR